MNKGKEVSTARKIWKFVWVSCLATFGGLFALLVVIYNLDDTVAEDHVPYPVRYQAELAAKALAAETLAAELRQPISNLTYSEIDRAAREMTDVNFKGYAYGLRGTRVKWSGVVLDVIDDEYGIHHVLLDLDNTGIQDVYIDIGTDFEFALNFKRGVTVIFDGDISGVISNFRTAKISIKPHATFWF
jgi:hypothetical protein